MRSKAVLFAIRRKINRSSALGQTLANSAASIGKDSMARKAGTIASKQVTSQNLVKVWDLFVRSFHWSVVIAFAVAWYTGEIWGPATLGFWLLRFGAGLSTDHMGVHRIAACAVFRLHLRTARHHSPYVRYGAFSESALPRS